MAEKKIDRQKTDKVRKNAALNLRIDESVMDDIHMISLRDEDSVSEVVRKAIKMYINLRKSTY